jgi:hypothetical protein
MYRHESYRRNILSNRFQEEYFSRSSINRLRVCRNAKRHSFRLLTCCYTTKQLLRIVDCRNYHLAALDSLHINRRRVACVTDLPKKGVAFTYYVSYSIYFPKEK